VTSREPRLKNLAVFCGLVAITRLSIEYTPGLDPKIAAFSLQSLRWPTVLLPVGLLIFDLKLSFAADSLQTSN
jgi:hypothetical protein